MSKQDRPVKNCHLWLYISDYKKAKAFADKHEITLVDIVRAALTGFLNKTDKAILDAIERMNRQE